MSAATQQDHKGKKERKKQASKHGPDTLPLLGSRGGLSRDLQFHSLLCNLRHKSGIKASTFPGLSERRIFMGAGSLISYLDVLLVAMFHS